MKKRILAIAVIIVLAVLAIVWKLSLDSKLAESLKAAPADPAVPVDVYILRDTTATFTVTTVGTLKANESVMLVSELSRRIESIEFRDGAAVGKGQLLVKLDDSDTKARLKKLETELALAETTAGREKTRFDGGAVSRQRLDEVNNTVDKLKADIGILEVELSKTQIRAPFAGRLGLRDLSVGAFVNPNTPLVSVQDLSTIKIDFSVPERYANDIKVGEEIEFTVDYLPGKQKAIVTAIEPDVDVKTRSCMIRAIARNSDLKLVPGTSAKIALAFTSEETTVFVPSEALLPSISGYQVYVCRSGKATLQKVKTGIRAESSVQILDGIAVGDTVIITNVLRLKPDSPVKITSYKQ
jgi:membrane fusion protein (multidrug efflux system)